MVSMRLVLTDEDAEKLRALALAEYRDTSQMAAVLVREGLRRAEAKRKRLERQK